MLKRIRNVHSLFYLPLAFLAFPVLGVFFFAWLPFSCQFWALCQL